MADLKTHPNRFIQLGEPPVSRKPEGHPHFSPPDRKGLLDFMLESAFAMLLHHAPTQYPARAARQWIPPSMPSIPPELLATGSRPVSRQSQLLTARYFSRKHCEGFFRAELLVNLRRVACTESPAWRYLELLVNLRRVACTESPAWIYQHGDTRAELLAQSSLRRVTNMEILAQSHQHGDASMEILAQSHQHGDASMEILAQSHQHGVTRIELLAQSQVE